MNPATILRNEYNDHERERERERETMKNISFLQEVEILAKPNLNLHEYHA